MAWQLKNESLHHHCTAKGSYVAQEEVADFVVAIVHQKGVVLCE